LGRRAIMITTSKGGEMNAVVSFIGRWGAAALFYDGVMHFFTSFPTALFVCVILSFLLCSNKEAWRLNTSHFWFCVVVCFAGAVGIDADHILPSLLWGGRIGRPWHWPSFWLSFGLFSLSFSWWFFTPRGEAKDLLAKIMVPSLGLFVALAGHMWRDFFIVARGMENPTIGDDVFVISGIILLVPIVLRLFYERFSQPISVPQPASA
jgi:hypothetical protein